jgi:uncharacterized protein GlcG (DUF336 family)
LGLAAALPAHADDATVTYKSLAPDVAFDMARAALDQCRKEGFQVEVVVIDCFGQPLVVLRDRFAGLGAIIPNVTMIAGGMIVQSAESTLGGIGIGGAPGGDKDEACAKAGLSAVQDRLDF